MDHRAAAAQGLTQIYLLALVDGCGMLSVGTAKPQRLEALLSTVSDHSSGWSLTLYGTMYLMAIRYDVPICECGSCGHRWLAESDRLPVRCPSRRCRSPQWNDAGHVEPVPVVKAKPARKLPAVSTASPATLARLAAVATHPPIGTKCPHGWANWLQCPKCHP